MMILKEGNGWSDAQLFDKSRFNLKVMRALGYMNMDDDILVESTYYEFRRLIEVHQQSQGVDLIEVILKQLTIDQIKELNVSGKKIRLDSKLIQSTKHKAQSTWLHLVLEAIRVSITELGIIRLAEKLSAAQYELLTQLKEKTASNITYTLDKHREKELLKEAGNVTQSLLEIWEESMHHSTS
jgi:YesN/AraC family two-component response regulator